MSAHAACRFMPGESDFFYIELHMGKVGFYRHKAACGMKLLPRMAIRMSDTANLCEIL